MFFCIDTVTAQSGIALTDGKRVFFEKLEARQASDQILGNTDKLIKKADIQASDLKGVFVLRGPGSFTGLRVGIAVANQFAHQLKIPIAGLQTEEWYQYRTDKKDFIYLQSMNRDQVYLAGRGKFRREFPPEIIAVSDCHYELLSKKARWLGQVNKEHRQALSDIAEITDLRSAEETWKEAARSVSLPFFKLYNLIEPFYGKAPTITRSKNKL